MPENDVMQIIDDDDDDDRGKHWKEMRIVAAAILHEARIYTMAQPARHYQIARAMGQLGIMQNYLCTEGFLTDCNTFVRRKPAFMIAIHAKQPFLSSVKDGESRDLMSEDLW